MIKNSVNIVMYHYVFDNDDPRFNKLKGLSIQDFRAQLELLSKRYRFRRLLSGTDRG